jgi:tetratricopeptide (TPR) repeat protein
VQNLDFQGLVSTSYWGEIVDAGLYRPLTLLSFGLNRLAGPAPFGFHLANDLLHGFAAVLAFLVARTLGLSPLGSLAAGLLFAVHPALSEAVNAIVGRADILAFSFSMGAFVLFAWNASPVLVGGAFFLALLSKESAAFALPLFVLRRRDPGSVVPLGIAVLAYAAFRYVALDGFGISGREIGFLDNPLAGATLATRLRSAPMLVFHYAELVLWPEVLSADYSFDQIPIPVGLLDGRVLAGTALLAILIFVATRSGAPGFAAAAFLLPLAGSVHLLFPLGTIFAERLLYLPMIGAALAFGIGVEAASRRSLSGAGLLLGVVVAAGAYRSWARNRDWIDNETLFRRTVETSPRSARSHFLLGAELLEKKRFAEAARSLEKGLEIYPDHLEARMSLGEALLAAGEPAAAAAQFGRVLSKRPRAPEVRRAAAEAALAEGRARARDGDFPRAREAFERALALDPESPAAWNYLGLAFEREGRVEEARRHYERALALEPDHTDALLNLASLRLNEGDLAGAEAAYRRTLELDPDSYEAYNGLGITLAREGRRAEARAAFEKAIAIAPEIETARENLRALESK